MVYLIKQAFKIFFFALCFVNAGLCLLLFEGVKVTFTLLGVNPTVMFVCFMIFNLSIFSIIWGYDSVEQIPDPKFLRYLYSSTVFFLKLIYLYFSIWLTQAYYTTEYVIQSNLDYFFFDSDFVFLRNWSKQEFADQLNSLAAANHVIIPSNIQDEIVNSVITLATLKARFVDFAQQMGCATTNLVETFQDPTYFMQLISSSPTLTMLAFTIGTIFFIFFICFVIAFQKEYDFFDYWFGDENETD